MTQQNPSPQPDDVGKKATRNKRARPFTIESRGKPGSLAAFRHWREWGRYRTADERDRALEQLSRKYSFYEWRANGGKGEENGNKGEAGGRNDKA